MKQNDKMTKTDMVEYLFDKAHKNVEKWGLQDIKTLALAIARNSGEIAQGVLEFKHERKTKEQIIKEIFDLLPLCIQLVWRLEKEVPDEPEAKG